MQMLGQEIVKQHTRGVPEIIVPEVLIKSSKNAYAGVHLFVDFQTKKLKRMKKLS